MQRAKRKERQWEEQKEGAMPAAAPTTDKDDEDVGKAEGDDGEEEEGKEAETVD